MNYVFWTAWVVGFISCCLCWCLQKRYSDEVASRKIKNIYAVALLLAMFCTGIVATCIMSKYWGSLP